MKVYTCIMNNNYCKKCRLRDGCLQKCKEAEVYEQGYSDAYKVLKVNMRQEKEKDGNNIKTQR